MAKSIPGPGWWRFTAYLDGPCEEWMLPPNLQGVRPLSWKSTDDDRKTYLRCLGGVPLAEILEAFPLMVEALEQQGECCVYRRDDYYGTCAECHASMAEGDEPCLIGKALAAVKEHSHG